MQARTLQRLAGRTAAEIRRDRSRPAADRSGCSTMMYSWPLRSFLLPDLHPCAGVSHLIQMVCICTVEPQLSRCQEHVVQLCALVRGYDSTYLPPNASYDPDAQVRGYVLCPHFPGVKQQCVASRPFEEYASLMECFTCYIPPDGYVAITRLTHAQWNLKLLESSSLHK